MCGVISKEARDTATVDLQGFFLQTEEDKDEQIIIMLTGAVALLLVESDNAKWRKHLKRENGKWIICTLATKVIYGTVKATLKAYKKLARYLRSWRLEMNPYDPCVSNKLVNR